MDAIESITDDGIAICRPRHSASEPSKPPPASNGWELRCYPSTVAKATVGGFLGGGSGGIGSVAHGGLRDFATVRALEVVTMEPEPRILLHEGAKRSTTILHAWGTNGIITKVWLALTPAVEWAQCAVTFDTFADAFTFSEKIATDPAWTKRLVTTFESPIPSCFAPILRFTRESKALIFLMIAASQLASALEAAARQAGGEITLAAPYTGLRTVPLLSDYTWNHTTLWAMKQDPAYTYLQCGFSPTEARSQFQQLRERFGQDFLFHFEFMKTGSGVVDPRLHPARPLHHRRTPQRDDRLLPIHRRQRRQPAQQQRRRRWPLPRGQRPAPRQAQVRSARPAQSRQDDHLPATSPNKRSPQEVL